MPMERRAVRARIALRSRCHPIQFHLGLACCLRVLAPDVYHEAAEEDGDECDQAERADDNKEG